MNEPLQAYRRQQILSSRPEQLVVLLYREAIKQIEEAKRALAQERWQALNDSVQSVRQILWELRASLNGEGGEIAGNLDSLYDFYQRQILQAQVRQDPQMLDDVAEGLRELAAAWMEASKQLHQQAAAAGQVEADVDGERQ